MDTEATSFGMDSVDVVESYCSVLPPDTELSVIEVPRSAPDRPKPQLSPELARIEAAAIELRREAGVPYWHAIILLAERAGLPLPASIVEAAGFHASHSTRARTTMSVSDIQAGALREAAMRADDTVVLALLSTVTRPDGTCLHIPMLDFRIKPSASSLLTAAKVAGAMRQPGYLANSGNSYHFYGLQPVQQEDYQDHLLRGLLFAPVTDQRWIAHQLLDGESALRISPITTGTTVPRIVWSSQNAFESPNQGTGAST